MIDTLIITVCYVIVIDQVRFTDEITTIISRLLTSGRIVRPFQLKPFTCSLCMSFWTNLIYIYCTDELSVFMLLYILALSWLTPVINTVLTFVRMGMLKIFEKIGDIINI